MFRSWQFQKGNNSNSWNEITPTQNHNYHWRSKSPIFSRKWTILGSFIMLNWCIYLLKPFKRKTCLQNLTLHKMTYCIVSWLYPSCWCLCIVTVDLKRMNQCEKRVCTLYTMLLLVLYAHICLNTHFSFCVCIYFKHKQRQYAPQRLSWNNSRSDYAAHRFVRNGHHWNWADCYGRIR